MAKSARCYHMTCLDSASHRSNFLGVFASYIAPAANSNYYARAHSLAGQSVRSPFRKIASLRAFNSWLWMEVEGAAPENNKKVEKE